MKTYRLVEVPEEQIPVTGELRFAVHWGPNPAEPLDQTWPLSSFPVVWTGEEWIKVYD